MMDERFRVIDYTGHRLSDFAIDFRGSQVSDRRPLHLAVSSSESRTAPSGTLLRAGRCGRFPFASRQVGKGRTRASKLQ